MTTRNDIIRAMARTIEVLSYTDWCDAWDEADRDGRGTRPEAAVSAGPGKDWFDVAPETDDPGVREDWLIEAAILYGRIAQEWGTDPWSALFRAGQLDEAPTWGHYAVMPAVGHGVSWEDDHEPLTYFDFAKGQDVELTVRGIGFDVPLWPGRWPDDEEV